MLFLIFFLGCPGLEEEWGVNTQGGGQISGARGPLLHIVTPSTRLVLWQAAQRKSLQVSEVPGPLRPPQHCDFRDPA